jgi:hypothetical protein
MSGLSGLALAAFTLAMGDSTLPPAGTRIVGMTGSGKTTFAHLYMLNAGAACNFIFDDLGRSTSRLKILQCSTASECENALATRWVLFNPHRMFPGELKKAFRWFCYWIYHASQRGPGKKLVLFDEDWRFQNRDGIPLEYAMISQTGREENIELIGCTQEPQLVNSSLTGSATELVCFHLGEPEKLRAIAGLGADPVAVKNLPLGEYLSYNRVGPGVFHGRVF